MLLRQPLLVNNLYYTFLMIYTDIMHGKLTKYKSVMHKFGLGYFEACDS